jgi:Spy/CpxP family protein refolding chaperone
MKTLKLILASLLISFGVNAQKVNTQKLNAKKIERKDLTPEQKAKMQTEKMKTELNLTNEQYDRAYQINLGIIQKNKSLQ